jgi:hypothetical protein
VDHTPGGIQGYQRRQVIAFKAQITVRIIFKDYQVIGCRQVDEVLASI